MEVKESMHNVVKIPQFNVKKPKLYIQYMEFTLCFLVLLSFWDPQDVHRNSYTAVCFSLLSSSNHQFQSLNQSYVVILFKRTWNLFKKIKPIWKRVILLVICFQEKLDCPSNVCFQFLLPAHSIHICQSHIPESSSEPDFNESNVTVS